MEEEVKYEYKVERIRKRKKTKLEKSIIIISIFMSKIKGVLVIATDNGVISDENL